MIQLKRIKNKKNTHNRHSPKKYSLLWERVSIFFPWKKRRGRKRKVLITQESLGDFLRDYTIISKRSLGKKYHERRRWILLFEIIKKVFRKIVFFVSKTTFRLTVTFCIFVFICGIIPTILGAPQSRTVTTKAEWTLGQFSGVTTESATDAIQLSPSGTWTARVWTPPEDVIAYGHSSVMVGDYLYIFRGYSGNAFWRYDTLKNTWDTMASLPQPAYYGADLTYNVNSGKIYATFGGYSQKFYSYDIEANSWTRLGDLLDTPWTGSCIESDGNSIFVVRGNGSTDFWEYDIVEGDWINRPPTPLAVGAGADLVNGQNGSLYFLRGNGSQNFYRYDIAGRRWYSTIASTPSTGCTGTTCTFGNEQRGVYWNGNLFFMRSNGLVDLLQYNIVGNSWSILTTDPTPQAVNYGSLTLNTREDYIYGFRANGTTDFWKFDPDGTAGQRWIGPKQVQNASAVLQPVGTGGDLLWNRQTGATNYVYALQGNNTANLYRYDVTNNNWSTIAASPALGFNKNNDQKGTVDSSGNLYTLRYNYAAAVVYIFNGTGWNAMSLQPATAASGEGAGLAFVGSDLYYMRAGTSACMYKYTAGAWGGCTNIAVINGGTTTTYYPYVGARIESDGTDLFVMPGDGETSFLKYTVSAGTWSNAANTPFSQYYGTDMTYNSTTGKIYAIAGMYKDETWEYNISGNSWRKIPNNQKFTFGRGPYNGASIEFAGDSSIYATIGQGVAVPSASADIWSYTVPATNFPTTGTNTYLSQQMDLGQVSNGTAFSFTENKPTNTNVIYEACSNSSGEECSSWHNISDGDISDHDGFSLERYVWIRITLSTTDGASTPTVSDYTISYASSDDEPAVPINLVAKSDQAGTAISSDTEYVYEHPYFSWSAGTDNGSGVAGYYVYFGKSSSADPATSGTYQTANYYSVNEAMSYDTDPVHTYGTYYLIIKAKDGNGLISDAWSPFIYKYKGVSPYETVIKTSQDNFDEVDADFDSGKVSYSAVTGSLRLGNVSGFWNQKRLSASPLYTYIGSEFAIGGCKAAGLSQLNGNHCLYTFQGNNLLPFMRYEIETDTWISSTSTPLEMAAAPAAVYNGGAMVEGPSGYIYATRGATLPTFWRYDIANKTWLQLDDAPKNFDYGSILSYDGNRYIYAMPGADDALFRYDTCNEQGGDCTPEWTQLANADFGNPNTVDGQRTSYGADSIYDGRNNLYILQGNLYPYFAKYSIADDGGYGESQNTWTPLPPAPIGFYVGGTMTFDGDHTIYALAGNTRMKFLKFDMNTSEWSFLPDAPATISYGASLKYYNNYIYATRGGTYTTFYRYSTTTNTWETPNRDFFGPHNVDGSIYLPFSNGALMADDGTGNIYLGRGGYDTTFGKYNTATGTFTSLSKLPMGAYNGANIVYNGTENTIYYIPGSGIRARRSVGDTKSPYFYKYNITTNVWSEITTDRPLAQVWTGSSMTYDGSRYIYLTQGNGATTWWRYDTEGSAGSRWLAMSVTSSCTSGEGSKIIYKSGTIYRIQAGNTRVNCKISGDFATASWTTLNLLPANVSYGAALMDGKDGYLYVTQGGNLAVSNYYRYDTTQPSPTWETLSTTVPGQVTYGGIGTNLLSRNWVITGAGGGTTYGDGLYNYVVGSASGATGFEKTGTYTSEAINLVQAYRFANLKATYVLPANTGLEIQTRTSANGSVWDGWVTASNDHTLGDIHTFSINSDPNSYIQIKAIFSSSDQIFSPRLDDLTINYYQDLTAPSNPTVISAYDASIKTAPLTTDTWYNHSAPYFEWPGVGEVGGASDNAGGSGVSGYYVYFGTEIAGEPVAFQEETNYTATGLVSGSTYYLRIQAIDNAGIPAAESYTAFTYKFDSAPPTNPSTIEVNPTGYSSASLFTMTWAGDAIDANSGLAKFRYRTGGDDEGVWTEIPDPASVSIQIPPYRPNKNTFYLVSVDNAGNTSTPLVQDYYYSGGSASPPDNLTVDPDEEDNATNSFTFTWDLPESYSGDSAKLKYYYSINVWPTAYNTIETTARAAGPGPYATQYGKNTFYVVALNEGGSKSNPTDIDWANPAQVDFYAETTAPSPPNNIQAFDTSDREAAEYSVAVKWSVPTSYDPGNFAGYAIYRSTDNITFSEVATTTGSAYVDTGLESKLYYFYAKSKDKTNNYSIATSTVSLTPTGRYTSPPTLVGVPKVTVQSFAANFTWATNRVASSFVEFGEGVALGETNGQVDSVTDHTVDISGLSAGKKHYYRVKYIDPDGNIGTSEILNFTTLPPPTISEVLITDIVLKEATVSWKTNTSATCTLTYGVGTIEESSSGSSHVTRISGLSADSTYKINIDCIDADLNEFSSDEYTFVTPKQPTASDVTVQNEENVDLPTLFVTYKTNVPTTTLVYFKHNDESSPHTFLTSERVAEHEARLPGLDPAKEYTLTIAGTDENGIDILPLEQKITTKSDSRPPKIIVNRSLGKVLGRGNNSQANVYIKIETDEETTVKVRYAKGVVTSTLEQSASSDSLNTYHLITIPAEPGQVYSYEAEAYDSVGNLTKSEITSVVVEKAKASATEVITGTFSARFGWMSNLWTK
jgi:hypothetical protein